MQKEKKDVKVSQTKKMLQKHKKNDLSDAFYKLLNKACTYEFKRTK